MIIPTGREAKEPTGFPLFSIAIDGPAGAGKSTVAREVARRLGICYVDTGALFRTIGLATHRAGIEAHDEEKLDQFLKTIKLHVVVEGRDFNIFLDGHAIGEELRERSVGPLASAVSKVPVVRNFLLELERALGRERSVVMEGRDIGTVVLPEARFKFFLDATPEERGRRRYQELIERGQVGATVEEIVEEIRMRDEQDRNRVHAPLRPAEGAVILDTTGRSIEDVIETIVATVGRALSTEAFEDKRPRP